MKGYNFIEMAKEITIAALSGNNIEVNAETGKSTAEFLEAIYNKLDELTQSNDAQ